MEGVLKMLECGPDCGFVVRSHDEWEIISIGMEHLREKHGVKKVSVQDVRAGIVVAQALYRDAKEH
jgi:predicted small metal-binding protein